MASRTLRAGALLVLAGSPALAWPDYVAKASQLACQGLTRITVDSRYWRQGGTPDATP